MFGGIAVVAAHRELAAGNPHHARRPTERANVLHNPIGDPERGQPENREKHEFRNATSWWLRNGNGARLLVPLLRSRSHEKSPGVDVMLRLPIYVRYRPTGKVSVGPEGVRRSLP